MPRIPVYTGGDVATPSTIPYQRLGAPGGSVFAPAVESLQQSSRSLAEVAAYEGRVQTTQAKVDNTLRNQEIDYDIADKMEQFKTEYDRRQTYLTERGDYPEQIDEQMKAFSRDYTQALAGNLRYPESETKFLAKMIPVVGQSQIATTHEMNRRRYGDLETREAIMTQQDVIDAVTNPTEGGRDAAIGRIQDRILGAVRSGRNSGEQGAAKSLSAAREIQKGEFARDLGDPAKASEAVNRALTGGYPFVGGLAEQRQMAFTALDRQYTIAERERVEVEREIKQVRDAAYADAVNRAWDGTLTRGEFDRVAKENRFEASQVNHLRELMAREPNSKEPESDRSIRDVDFRGTATISPTVNQTQLDFWRNEFLAGRPGLNFKDWQDGTNRLR